MAEPAHSNPGMDLDRNVDELLHELETSGLPKPPGQQPGPSIEGAAPLGDDSPVPAAAAAVPEDQALLADLTQQVDALIAESQARPTGAPPPIEPAMAAENKAAEVEIPAEAPAEIDPPAQLAAIAETPPVTTEAAAPTAEATPAPAPEITPPPGPAAPPAPDGPTIDALDAELANLAAGLMNDPAVDPTAAPIAAQPTTVPGPTASEPSSAAAPTAAATTPPKPADPAAAEAKPSEANRAEAAAPQAKPAAPEARKPEPAPATAEAQPVPAPPAEAGEPKPARSRAGFGTVLSLARRLAAPVSNQVVTILSAPLRNKPKIIRDSVGWVAIFTLFNATGLWGYILLVRKPAIPEATITAAGAHGAADSGHGEKAAEAGHGDAKAESGHGAAKETAKKDAGHGAAKADAGHGAKKEPAKKDAGHGSAKKAPAKKNAHASAKKPAKKETAHGSGH